MQAIMFGGGVRLTVYSRRTIPRRRSTDAGSDSRKANMLSNPPVGDYLRNPNGMARDALANREFRQLEEVSSSSKSSGSSSPTNHSFLTCLVGGLSMPSISIRCT